MATRILVLISILCSLLAGCAGRVDDAPTPPEPAPVVSCWTLCTDCGLTSHWVWTCEGHPPSVPDGCAWTEHADTLVIECPDESADLVPAQCEALPHNDANPGAPYLYECGAAK